jgi:hypothetical protein
VLQGTLMLKFAFGLTFPDLYASEGLARVDASFLAFLRAADAGLAERLAAARADKGALDRGDESALLIAIAPHLEDFVALLFGVEAEVAALQEAQHELAPLYACKRQVVQRKAMNKYKADEAAGFDSHALRAELETRLRTPLEGLAGELAFARAVGVWSADEAAHSDDIDLALRYAAWAAHTPAGKAWHRSGVLFKAPRKLDYLRLIPVEHEHQAGIDSFRLPNDHLRRRDGFALTDAGTDLAGGLDQANYCIWCHEQQKDSCSSGLREKKTSDGGAPPFKRSPFGVPQNMDPAELQKALGDFQLPPELTKRLGK